MQTFNFNYNVSLKTINCINAISFTYHINNFDYPVLHRHLDYYEFTIILSGEIKNHRNGQIETIEKDMLFISTPSDEHMIVRSSKEDVKILNIVCREEEIKKIFDSMFTGMLEKIEEGPKVFTLSKDVLFQISSNIELVNSISVSDWKKSNDILKSTVISIINYLFIEDAKNENSIEKWEMRLNDLKASQDFYTMNVNQLCERLEYSRTQLNRIFNSRYQMSPHEYLMKSKMEYAASLLAYTDYSISRICEFIGYQNPVQFSENFKREYSLSPSEYRRGRKE